MAKNKEFTATRAEDSAASPIATPANGGSDKAAESAAAAKMNAIFNENDSRNQTDELEEAELQGPDNPDGDAVAAQGEESKLEDEESDEVTDDGATGDEPDPARQAVLDKFDPNLKQIAKELGNWSESDIEDFIVANPVLARITFARISDGYNALSQQYARGAQPNQVAPQSQQTPATTASASVLDELMTNPKKLAALQEVAGSELTEGFIKPLLAERARQIEDRAFIDDLRKESFVRDINESFAGFGTNGFEELYGKNGEVTPKQNENRFAVGQLADQIRTGAKAQNVSMTVREALSRAHLIVSAGTQKEQARREVQKQVKARSSQITARPTARRPKAPASDRGDAAALQGVADFWTEASGD